MPLPSQKYREAVLQILYAREFDVAKEEIIPLMMAEIKTTRSSMVQASSYVDQILEKQGEIDPKIQELSTEYRLERISKVERAILRLGIYELLYCPQIPPKVAIAEAIRLCRKFGTPESAEFINAIIDGVYKKHALELSNQPQLV